MDSGIFQDWPEAQRRRNFQTAIVAPEYHINDGVIMAVATKPERHYFPIARPGIVSELAKLRFGDEEAALAFTRRWGLLGYPAELQAATLGRVIPWPWGDPLPWLWAHANGVHAVMTLRKALDVDDDELEATLEGWRGRTAGMSNAHLELERRLRGGQGAGLVELARPHFEPSSDSNSRFCSLTYGHRHLIRAPFWLIPNPGQTIRETAWSIIENILNGNLAGVSPAVTFRDGEVGIGPRWDSPVSVAYLHLAGAIARGRVQTCDHCGAPFLQTDRRQRFCPPRDPHNEESYCAAIRRQETLRTKQKRATVRHTTTRRRREGKKK